MNKQKNYNVLGYQGRRRKVIKASNSFWSFTPTNKRFSWIPLHRIQKQLYACSLIYSSVVGKFWAGHSIKYSRIHNEEPQSNPNHKRPFANSQQALVEVRMGCSHVFHWVLRKLGLDRSQLEQSWLPSMLPQACSCGNSHSGLCGREETRYFSVESLCTENQQGNQGSDCRYSQSSCHRLFTRKAREFLTEVTVAWDTTYQLSSCHPSSECSYPITNRRQHIFA